MALIVLLAAGLYSAGLLVMRMTAFNRIAIEARQAGIQMLEETAAHSLDEIVQQFPQPPRTNSLLYGETVVRTLDVVGHDANRNVVSNLAASAYLELHVHVAFASPFTRQVMTNTFSTLAP